MTTAHAEEAMLALAAEWLAAYAADPRMAAALVPLEREIWEGLAQRPLHTWCHGCLALAHALYTKASGAVTAAEGQAALLEALRAQSAQR